MRDTSPNIANESAEAQVPPESAEIEQASLALLNQLETSLKTSQQALLASDLDTLEKSTAEQTRLQRALDILWPKTSKPLPQRKFALPVSDLLRNAQMRVLHQARIQAALLRRAQRHVRTISHLLAGPGAEYSLPCSPSRGVRNGENEGGDPCRA